MSQKEGSMDLQEAVKGLTDEQRETVMSAIETEKQRGIDEARRKGGESAKLRKENEAFRSAIKNTFEIDLNDVAELPDALSKFKTKTLNSTDFVPVKDFAVLKKQVEEERAQRERAETNLRTAKTAEKLNQVMGDNFYAKDLLIKNLVESGQVRLTSSDDVVFVSGDEEIDAAKGLEALKKKRPDLVKNNSKPGGGSAGGKEHKAEKTITMAEFEAMSGKERAAKMAEGYKLTS
jgi:hypothetical protein